MKSAHNLFSLLSWILAIYAPYTSQWPLPPGVIISSLIVARRRPEMAPLPPMLYLHWDVACWHLDHDWITLGPRFDHVWFTIRSRFHHDWFKFGSRLNHIWKDFITFGSSLYPVKMNGSPVDHDCITLGCRLNHGGSRLDHGETSSCKATTYSR